MVEQPSGTVTLVFTDIEGSTRLLHELGQDAYLDALAAHRRIVREACARHAGYEVDYEGDAFFYAFQSAVEAVAAVEQAMRAHQGGPVRIRVGVHTGEPGLDPPKYVGLDVHRAARIMSAAHGGQVLLSESTHGLVELETRDLGLHRLKDLPDLQRFYQLGSQRFPPLRTISNTNLPRPASSFVGRRREVEEVISQLRDGARLITLTGPGGSGKTRLAIEAAAELVPDHRNGVFWVGLAALRDPTLVSETIAQTLGAKESLSDHIGEGELLLLLDNLEQVIEAAPGLSSLLEACPNLRLLVTSRELLRVRGETGYPVLPLAQPEAVELFCARAGAEPDEAVHELCRALESLPLALELAAARSSVLSPEQILERLSGRLDLLRGGRDADPRQQTLRATVDWSHELLSEEEKALFARLSVFRGGCTLGSAQKVADADLDRLQSLVDKSLLRHMEDRFWMLETIREYALERLDEWGEAEELRRRHAEHFLALAEEAEPNLRGSPKEWLDRLAREHDNLRAALDHLEASGDTQLVLRLAGALPQFWTLRGHWVEGRRRLESALRADERPTAARAKALDGAAGVALSGGDGATARLWAEQALALYRQLGDARGIAESRYAFAYMLGDEGAFGRAQLLFEESVQAFRELGDEHFAARASFCLAWMCEELGDLERARALHEDNLRLARALSNERNEADTLHELARLACRDGRVEDALLMLKESLRINRGVDIPLSIAQDLSAFAGALAVEGRAGMAARLLSSSEALHKEFGVRMRSYLRRRNEETLTTIRSQLDDRAFAEAWEQGQALTLDEAVALALDS
jgi:predicted ATPase